MSSRRLPRIAILSNYFPTREEPYRGHSTYQTLIQLLDRAHWQAFVPLPVYPSWYPLKPKEFRYSGNRMSSEGASLIPACSLHYTTFPLLSRPFHGRFVRNASVPILKEFSPDLILNYWLYPDGYAAVHAAESLGIPSIVCSIGSDLRRIGDSFTRRFTAVTLQKASFVLTVSEELRRQALAYGIPESKTRTILNGCDPAIFHPQPRAAARAALQLPTSAKVIVYVGNLIPSKGVPELVQAFQQIRQESSAAVLVLVGEGPLKDSLPHTSRDGVMFPGATRSAGVAQWIAASDLLCLPSHSEGCPNVVVEALACGRPVVATHVGGTPELVHPANGILVPPRDPSALTAALRHALHQSWNEDLIASTSTRLWRDAADETWEVCRRMLASSPQASELDLR